MAIHPIIAERKLEALRHALGDTILAALVEPAVVEILANPDGRLILDRSGEGRMDTAIIRPQWCLPLSPLPLVCNMPLRYGGEADRDRYGVGVRVGVRVGVGVR